MKKVIVCIIILCVFACYAVTDKFYKLALDPKVPKNNIFESSHNKSKNDYSSLNLSEKNNQFMSNTEEVTITSFDNLLLNGYIKKANNSNKWALLVHGYTQKASGLGHIGLKFLEKGYNVLIPELRGHGKSQGSYIGMGIHDSKDIVSWVLKIASIDPNAEIVLYGLSMGAATVMNTSSKEDMQKYVKCIIEDAGYTSAWDMFGYQLDKMYNLPAFPIMDSVNIMTKHRASFELKEIESIKEVRQCKYPMLFIHGYDDTFVPFDMGSLLYETAKCPYKQSYFVKGAGHAETFKIDPDKYYQVIFDFVDKFIK